MRKLLLGILFLIPFSAFSQVGIDGLGFNYSALVRDTAGRVQPSKKVNLRFTLLLGQNGTSVNSPWIEEQEVTTDAYGFVNVVIGNGKKVGGTATSFANVDFTIANYWVLIEVFNTFTNIYEPLAKQAFQTVPYAKVAGALAGGSVIPAGTIVAFAGDKSKVPAGWLLCDGREFNITDAQYQALFNSIQYSWGMGTGSNPSKFRVPNTQGYFLRGVNNGTGHDPDAAMRTPIFPGGNAGDNVGSLQSDDLQRHQHLISSSHNVLQFSDFGHLKGGVSAAFMNAINNPAKGGGALLKTDNDGGGNETRPKNVYVNYIIKL